MMKRTSLPVLIFALTQGLVAQAQTSTGVSAPPRAEAPQALPSADFVTGAHAVPSSPTLRVIVAPSLAKQAPWTTARVVAMLNVAKIGVSDERVAHFNRHISPNSDPVTGWVGTVESLRPIPDGILVTVRVRADQGRHFDTIALMEQYAIVDQQVTYVGSFEPPPSLRFILGF